MSFEPSQSSLPILVLNDYKLATEFVNSDGSWKIHSANNFEMFLCNYCGLTQQLCK